MYFYLYVNVIECFQCIYNRNFKCYGSISPILRTMMTIMMLCKLNIVYTYLNRRKKIITINEYRPMMIWWSNSNALICWWWISPFLFITIFIMSSLLFCFFLPFHHVYHVLLLLISMLDLILLYNQLEFVHSQFRLLVVVHYSFPSINFFISPQITFVILQKSILHHFILYIFMHLT